MVLTHTDIHSDCPVPVKRSEHEANLSPKSTPEVKNVWNSTSTPLRVFSAAFSIKDREKNAEMTEKDRRRKKRERERSREKKSKEGKMNKKIKTTGEQGKQGNRKEQKLTQLEQAQVR